MFLLQNKYAEAISFYKRVLTIEEKRLGSDHPDVASAIDNLATLYYYHGENMLAESLYKRALEIYEKGIWQRPPFDCNHIGENSLIL